MARMPETEVYRWRLSSRLKSELEEAARAEQKSLAKLLEEVTEEWLERFRGSNVDDAERQRILHEAALKYAGTLDRASTALFVSTDPTLGDESELFNSLKE